MRDDTETDFCDRLPGQHTGRLSLELQASEAAEWQRRIDKLTHRVRNLEMDIATLKALSPAAGESPVISPEPAQATERVYLHRIECNARYNEPVGSPGCICIPATPSAAVGASEPEACDAVPRSEYDRLIELLYQIGDLAHDASTGPERPDTFWDIRQMAYGVREHAECVVDSKPTNCHNPESEDTPPHNPVLGPVVGTATVTFHDQSKTVSPEVGKRYVCRNGEITGVVARDSEATTYPFNAIVPSAGLTSWTSGGRVFTDRLHEHDLIAEYHEPEPSPPAESPDDWVMITDPKHVLRSCDEVRYAEGSWHPCRASVGATRGTQTWEEFRCRRRDLPVVPAESPASQSSCSPVCALCGNVATCFGRYADHDKGFACDSCCGHGNEDGWCMTIGEYDRQNSAPSVHSPALPSPWRPMTEVPNCDWFWLAWNDGQVILSRDRSHWNLRSAVSWMPAVPPLHPNAAPSDKPRMRQVTLREYRHTDESTAWSSSGWLVESRLTGRTCVTEVPE